MNSLAPHINASSLRERIARPKDKVSLLLGEAESLTRRKAALDKEVGLAKGRLELKSTVSQFLEELQTEAHARRVGDFEKLLTALVTEILPHEAPIGLDLEIERGNPSLDIVSRYSGDRDENIYEDKGGALTNVVSMGLRMIAVVRSGMNRFLMLDESDCWIANKRVPAFYSVLKDASKKVGVQCLAISHHDIASFNEGIATAKLTGHPEMSHGVRIENSPRPYRWKDEEEGIRWIRLINFQGYADQTLHLSPGVNALVGENGIGKSSFIRAFRAVFYGEARDSLIRNGASSCTVEICFGPGKTLRWNRKSRRNPVNIWQHIGDDGGVVSRDGVTFETGGRSVPDWVHDKFKIGPVEGLDVHAIKQKEPVFLLNKPGSTRAAVLSVGKESGHIRTMITLHKEQCVIDAATVKSGEAEMARILDRLKSLEKVSQISDLIKKASELEESISQQCVHTEKLTVVLESVSARREVKEQNATRASVLNRLPDGSQIKAIENAVRRGEELVSASLRTQKTRSLLDSAKRKKVILSALPNAAPSLKVTADLSTLVERIERSGKSIRRHRAELIVLGQTPESEPTIIRSDELIKTGKAVKETRVATWNLQRRAAVFKALPAQAPTLKEAKELESLINLIDTSRAELARKGEGRAKVCDDLKAAERELTEMVGSIGNVCPLCNSQVEDVTEFLSGHDHNGDAQHV